ncbi:protein phosphatase [Actinomadura craniellae]|uniref:protein-serine/threonine phosphatase n=1 Tax=Actinomadura craniellae TaxID=2231787 RepID=A0A365H005_9ACTN|nr:SpoIIE family protein phosphatase [Actinomadura craniellae]RAY12425.1 protein phosphatase [Actinomadura craniellae]
MDDHTPTAGGVAEEGAPAIVLLDAAGAVAGWSRAAEALLGHRADDVLGRSVAVLLTPGDRAGRISAWIERFGEREHWSGPIEARHRDGHAILVHAEVSRLHARGGAAHRLLSVTPASAAVSGISMLEPFINRSSVALCIWDRDLRCVWLNEAAQRLQGFFPQYQVGRSLAEPLAGADARASAERVRAVLADGVPRVDRESHWVSADRSEERTLSISLFRIEGADGRPLGVCSLTLDITHSRARERLALLREASVRIGTTLDVRKTAQELAELAVPALADYVTVDLAEAALPDDEPLRLLAATEESIPVFRRAGMASIHPDFPEALYLLGDAVYVAPSSAFTEVLNSGRSHFEPVLDTVPGRWLDDDRLEVIHDTGMHSLIIVPLRARGDILGIAVFVRTDNPAPFTGDDLTLAEELVARAALSLDNARRYTRERTASLALQRHLLPQRLPDCDALELASHYLPSDLHGGVGGDWFDTIPLSGSRIALVVGDVTGHGINAAARMGRLRTAVRTLAYMELPPARLLTHLDNLVAQMGEGNDLADIALATCLYAVYDPDTRQCTVAAAGHPPLALVDPSGAVTFPRLPTGTPIGLGVADYESVRFELAEGTLLVLYTDGLIETRDADLDAGMDRLRAALARFDLPLGDLCTAVIGAMTTDVRDDDVTLLVARTRAPGG